MLTSRFQPIIGPEAMDADAAAVPSRRPRVLLAALGVAIIALVASRMWSTESAAPPLVTSNQPRTGAATDQAPIDPAELDVRLEALQSAQPGPHEAQRNPFRFQAKPTPPPSLEALRPAPPPVTAPTTPPEPPPPPPITLKFIGTVEKQGLKVAAVSDCKGYTDYAKEGDIVDGRYRLVKIGVESLMIEYVDGTGRTTIRLEGCPAR
jgi:hypothetical protein